MADHALAEAATHPAMADHAPAEAAPPDASENGYDLPCILQPPRYPVSLLHPGMNPRPEIKFCNSSFSTLKAIAASASPTQRSIVNRLGFRFIFHLPSFHKSNLNLFAWLLYVFHPQLQCFVLDSAPVRIPVLTVERARATPGFQESFIPFIEEQARALLGFEQGIIPVTVEHARAVLGFDEGGVKLPSPRDISSARQTHTRNKVACILSYGYTTPSISVTRARAVIRNLLGKERMTEAEEAAFRAAVVIFVVGTFLAPRPWSHDIDVEVLEAIALLSDDPDAYDWDWGQYTIDVLKEASVHVKHQLFSPLPTTCIELSGCAALFMIVYYMATADEPGVNWGNPGPQIQHFDSQELSRLDRIDLPKRQQLKSWNLIASKQEISSLGPSINEARRSRPHSSARQSRVNVDLKQILNDVVTSLFRAFFSGINPNRYNITNFAHPITRQVDGQLLREIDSQAQLEFRRCLVKFPSLRIKPSMIPACVPPSPEQDPSHQGSPSNEG